VDKTIREKYLEWVGDQSKRIPNDPRDWGQIVFEVGYEIAKKEMEERLKEAVSVIEFYSKETPSPGGCTDENFTYVIRMAFASNKRAREFLKSQNEISK
jgi:hypothetical protein